MDTLQTTTLKGKIEYTLHGSGKPVLIVIGGHTNSKETIFQKGLDPQKCCFITPSRPGYGLTPLTSQNKTAEGTAELFIALLDTLGIEKVTVFGISAGGLTALNIAANYPKRIEHLILLSALTKKWFSDSSMVYKGAKIIFAPLIERYTWTCYRICFNLFPVFMTKIMFKQVSTYRPADFTEDERLELTKMTLGMRSYHGFNNDLDQTIKSNTLRKIQCPTLILHSHYDNAVGLSHPQNAKDHINGSTLVIFNNRWGHLLWLGGEYDCILKELKKIMN
ncbi:alpha/beta fold hydrolase [Mucilaginibacter aquariorum]|uniref:Alpha/beta hydrolase n=1 Tax=Mucilaginibacter aquariorum TaxID=2967225 RepID=A0ABT1T3N1_9SPHI|nr:alpha/beta hydrolase [Mucilaginibacter aquariorum]MCQ6959179.1 alpha/beta hydrolase [Mucilaginibacter aquariorum]